MLRVRSAALPRTACAPSPQRESLSRGGRPSSPLPLALLLHRGAYTRAPLPACSITLIASFAYLLMALGGSIIIVQDGRQFLWARYADWLVTTPLLLLDLCLLAGISLPEILFLIVCDVLMVLAGFAGVVTTNPIAVWPMLIFGCICLGPIVWFLGSGLTSRATNPDVAKQFKTLSWLTIVLWSAYPLVWALGEGVSRSTHAGTAKCHWATRVSTTSHAPPSAGTLDHRRRRDHPVRHSGRDRQVRLRLHPAGPALLARGREGPRV